MLFHLYYSDVFSIGSEESTALFEAITRYGLGGGIYTKAADVGADLVGKAEYDLNEDDNAGDIAGIGVDLFGSFAESSRAASVIAAQSGGLTAHEIWGFVSNPTRM